MGRMLLIVLAVGLLFAAGCTTTSKATNFSGLTTTYGRGTHLNTTSYAIHVLGAGPVVGDATLQHTLEVCTSEAKASGATRFRIVQSDTTTYWWVLPPISFIIHPVIGNVAGDALP